MITIQTPKIVDNCVCIIQSFVDIVKTVEPGTHSFAWWAVVLSLRHNPKLEKLVATIPEIPECDALITVSSLSLSSYRSETQTLPNVGLGANSRRPWPFLVYNHSVSTPRSTSKLTLEFSFSTCRHSFMIKFLRVAVVFLLVFILVFDVFYSGNLFSSRPPFQRYIRRELTDLNWESFSSNATSQPNTTFEPSTTPSTYLIDGMDRFDWYLKKASDLTVSPDVYLTVIDFSLFQLKKATKISLLYAYEFDHEITVTLTSWQLQGLVVDSIDIPIAVLSDTESTVGTWPRMVQKSGNQKRVSRIQSI